MIFKLKITKGGNSVKIVDGVMVLKLMMLYIFIKFCEKNAASDQDQNCLFTGISMQNAVELQWIEH